MDDGAIERLRLLGEVIAAVSHAGVSFGEFMQGAGAPPDEACQHIENHMLQAAALLDKLAEVTEAQGAHGYSEADSAALAMLKQVFHGFGSVPVFMAQMDFTMGHGDKGEQWRQAAMQVRKSADYANRQRALWGPVFYVSQNSGVAAEGDVAPAA